MRTKWMCPMTGELANPWKVNETGVITALKRKPHLPYNMTMMYWNARGLARSSFKPNLLHLIAHNKPDILVLVETKVSRSHTADIVGSLPYDSWFLVEPVGFAGGILILWDPARVSLHVINSNAQGVHALVEVNTNNFFLSTIYANTKFRIRKNLWNDLIDVAHNIDMPWLVIGDFNEVLSQNEKWGGNAVKPHRIAMFSSTMDSCNLLDLGFNGPKFTWTNKRKRNPIYERLDRAFGNGDWLVHYPNSCVWHLPRISSDHAPILCTLDTPPPLARVASLSDLNLCG